MANQRLLGFTIFPFLVLFFQAVAPTDDLEVRALRDLYRALNSPAELKKWKLEGGDPCEESWTGKSESEPTIWTTGRCLWWLGESYNDGSVTQQLQWRSTCIISALRNLTRLYLQSNEFTGSVIFLADLHLHDLNIEDNHFSGVIPESFQNINSLWSKLSSTNFLLMLYPMSKNISSPPTTESSAIEKYPSHEARDSRNKRPGSGGIVIMVVGAVITVIGAAVFIAVPDSSFS
ncbi:hypothetical protein HAX54_028090 [Datura stramonium]|uniref:Leucine-rich repeat-containing N-terminal plant-type domain-containing protein n=1 Tax=Datura stramonium TaxID=4076 RepID=A0ABS8V3U4_DATST|nr:hypothetical protein [Datura stramonium]